MPVAWYIVLIVISGTLIFMVKKVAVTVALVLAVKHVVADLSKNVIE